MITAQEFVRRRRDLMATMSKNSIAILTAARTYSTSSA